MTLLRRHTRIALALTLCLGIAPALGAQSVDDGFVERLTHLEGTRPAQWRVVWTEDPATTATISWSTSLMGRDHRVRYDVRPRAGTDADHAFVQATHRDGEYTRNTIDRQPGAFYHHARLSGLEPSTTYWFVLESGGERSRELHFTTAPADDRPFALLSGGDSRTGLRARCFVNRTLARLAEDPAILALSHGGDYVTVGSRWDHWTRWLSHNELTTTDDGRVLPILPTRGNHEGGVLFDEVFDTPGGRGRNYFASRLSPEVTLLTLNSNISVAGDQLTWMEEQLADASQEARWLVASYHSPVYPAVKAPSEAKPFWPPLFDFYGLDVALESDGHCIKRTMPIRGDEPHPGGVTYVGEGGLGVPQRTPRTDRWYLQGPDAFVANGHHVVRLDFAPDGLRSRILRFDDIPEPNAASTFDPLVPPHAEWRYLAADDAPEGWNEPGYDDASWPVGAAGFGYGDDDDRTVLDDMRSNHSRVYVRRTLPADALAGAASISLMCRYDDAFIAYLNGREVARAEIDPPTAAGDDPRVHAHEASSFEAFPIEAWRDLLLPPGSGANVLALVGFNRMRSDRDFSLDPWLAGDRLSDPTRAGLAVEVIDDVTLPPRDR